MKHLSFILTNIFHDKYINIAFKVILMVMNLKLFHSTTV